MNSNDIPEILEDAQYAIDHVDDVLARELLEEIDAFLANASQLNPGLVQQLTSAKSRLVFVNFPNLSEMAAVDVMRNHFLDAFKFRIDLENRITALLFFYPDAPRDELRKKMKNALVQNQQKIGPLSIGQWIVEFEKMFPVQKRDLSASVRFVTDHPQTRSLTPIDRENLKDTLHIYDYLLVTTLPATGPVLEQILQTDPNLFEQQQVAGAYSGGSSSYGASYFSDIDSAPQSNPARYVQVEINKALNDYRKLGEQEISSVPLKLKAFNTPVRASIKNWLTDYRDFAGSGRHSAVDRGNYLFRSENGKQLNSLERQRVSWILKAIDESQEVTIDPDSERIVLSHIDGDESADQQPNAPKQERSEQRFQQPAPRPVSMDVPRESTRLQPPSFMPSAPVQNIHSEGEPQDIFDRNKKVTNWDSFVPKQIAHKEELRPQASFNMKEAVTFTSPQKLPFENTVKADTDNNVANVPQQIPSKPLQRPVVAPAAPAVQPSEKVINQQPVLIDEKSQSPKPFARPFRIVPSGYVEEDNGQPKVSGNTIDLRS